MGPTSKLGIILFLVRKFLFSLVSHLLLPQSLPASECFNLLVFVKQFLFNYTEEIIFVLTFK